MLDFDHYDKLKKASVVPEHIMAAFDDDDEADKLLVGMCLPALRVGFYAATHEPQLFSDLMAKMIESPKLPPYFHRKMLYGELFQCLCLLGGECLEGLLSELDCSDPVYNGLHNSVINVDFGTFENVMQGWNGSFSRVIPVCRLLSLELFVNEAFERIMQQANEISEIQELDRREQRGKALVSNMINAFIMKAKEVLSDELDAEVSKSIKKTYKENYDELRSFDDECFDVFIEGYQRGMLSANPNAKIEIVRKTPKNFSYKMLLFFYDLLATETSISPAALRVIKEALFVPEYETIWKQYEESGSVDFIIDEIDLLVRLQTPQIVESATQLPNKWELPVDFFDKSYLDDCDTDEYIPCFLDDQIQIDAVVNDKLNELKERLNVVFQDFVETLAANGCIDNDYITKASFAHALTGRKVDVKIKTVKWKYSQSKKEKGWLNNICHIASELYPMYIIDKNHRKLKKYDHINKVFDLDYDSLSPEIYQKINPDKFGSSYGYNADDFVKNAVEKFLNSVEIIKISIGA